MKALDLFAGTGWGVACQRIGIEEYGVEIMPEARASREAAGMTTVYHDVWEGLENPEIVPEHDFLIASPPCQTFSVAGKGVGRKALDNVLGLIPVAADPGSDLRTAGSGLDDRTSLVLTPLAYAVRYSPTYIALEQVPAALPVWNAIAEHLQGIGYSTAVSILNAEQYGVPQTRRRAILVARNDGTPATLPTPTHSRYYSRDPKRLDPGVLPWVSMSEALGWPETETLRSNYGTGGDPNARGLRKATEPSSAITSKAGSMKRIPEGFSGDPLVRLTLEEAAILQSYPPFPGWGISDRPSPALTSHLGVTRSPSGTQSVYQDAIDRGAFVFKPVEPTKSTVAKNGIGSRYAPNTVNITSEEGAVLQTYPKSFPFQGTKTMKSLQIGNAVPPLLAEHILRGLL